MLIVANPTVVYAIEKKIAFYVGHSNGGLASTFQTTISQELIKKGWDIDFKIIGNCAKLKTLMETANKPMLAGWSPDWNASLENFCYNPVKKENYISTFIISPRLLCGPYDDYNFFLVKGREYKIGVNQGQNHHVLLAELEKKTGVTFKIVEYKNSNYIKRAMQAKEIDVWYTTSGLVEHENKKQKCLYGTLTEEYANIIPLKAIISTNNVYSSLVGFLITNNKLKGELKDTLEKDINLILKSESYRSSLKSTGSFLTYNTKDEQLELIDNTTKSFKE